MKRYFIIFATMLAFAATSCSNDADDVEFAVYVDRQEISVGDEVNFLILSDCEKISVYPGDEGYDYTKSYEVINNGVDIGDEYVVLLYEDFVVYEATLRSDIQSFNSTAIAAYQLDEEEVIQRFYDEIVDKVWTNAASVYNAMFMLIPLMKPQILVMEAMLVSFNEYTAPEGGYSTGISLTSTDRYEYTYTHTYTEAGIYEAVIVGTNLGSIDYSSGGTYDIKRETKTIVISVTE